jgi:hypothetical protein
MIYIIDPTRVAIRPCPVFCHIKPCYGIGPTSK